MSTSRAFTVNLDSDEIQSRPCLTRCGWGFKVKILLNGNDDDNDDDIDNCQLIITKNLDKVELSHKTTAWVVVVVDLFYI